MTTREIAILTYAIYERARERTGLTDYAVGKLTGLRSSVFTDWKHGRYTPKHDKLVKISNAIGVQVSIFDIERS